MKTPWPKFSPHIIVIVVIELDVVAKGRVSVLVPGAVSAAIFVALLAASRMGAIAIVRIVVIVVHGRIVVGTFCVVLLLLGLG